MSKSKSKIIYTILIWTLVLVILGVLIYFAQKSEFLKVSPVTWIVSIILFFVVAGLFLSLIEIHLQLFEVRKDIHSVVAPKFLTVSPETNDLVELAIEVWRLESRINKISHQSDSQKDMVHNSIKKIKRYLDKNDIEILDYTNQKFNDGRNLDILSVETDPKLSHSMIKETKEPTILLKGQVVRKGKVIILAKSTDGFEGIKND